MLRLRVRWFAFRAALLAAPAATLIAWPAASGQVPLTPTKPVVRDSAKTLPVDGIAAVVGDQVILVSEVLAEVNRRRAAGVKVEKPADEIAL